MSTSPDPQPPERRPSIGELYEKAQQLYSGATVAVVKARSVSPRIKGLLGLSVPVTIALAALGIVRSPVVASAALVLYALAIAILIYRIADPPSARKGRRRRWTRPSQPRSRWRHQTKHGGPP